MKVVTGGSVNTEMLGIEGLDNDATSVNATTGATGHLSQQSKSAFGSRVVGQIESDISRNDAYQRHTWQIETFGDHLRTNEHIGSAVGKLIEEFRMSVM